MAPRGPVRVRQPVCAMSGPYNPELPWSRHTVIDALQHTHRLLCHANEVHFSPHAWSPGPCNPSWTPPSPWRRKEPSHPGLSVIEHALEEVGERRADGNAP